MLPFEKALAIVLDSVSQLGSERVDIGDALNRILAEDVKSDIDMPPFNRSAMDGYACRMEDLANELAIIETIPAGKLPEKTIGPNQCAKIMTGAPVPQGADCVVMVEFTENPTEKTVRFTGSKTSRNISPKGEDLKAGDEILRKGIRIEPRHIAALASVGCVNLCVSIRPKIGIIATGNELVEPAEKPAVSQIRNSNSFQLSAQIQRVGGIVQDYGIVGDEEEKIESTLKRAITENDVVILSGGVSMGDYDLVPGVLKKNGVEVLFEKIAVKPGKPTVFGVHKDAFCFGLPGNPVAIFVIFELVVKPFLYKMMGCDFSHRDIPMPLDEAIRRKKTKRQFWVPVAITDSGRAKAVEYHGSAHIGSLCGADGLVSMNVGIAEIKKGTIVKVRLI